ncbi:hypothetical protein SAMN05660662_0869 [Blastococcus aurantiacus]|uniref:Uncharacterized protein n=1 Tax=Blastococcus aurantiacus TaxID=1550231 RepID=A0A1G7HWR9_9ACTN|nr:hypothetical protein [Blastococcus aurantiacus]SDF04920.1 hypothetical protein SAMN05660662_0869 [Blastococcus aurantiacus]
MRQQPFRTPARVLAGAGATIGLALLTGPQRVLDVVAPEFPRERRWVVRVLGARMLAQHAPVLVRPAPELLAAGAGLDVLHAASVLPFVASARYGRTARISAAVALASAALAGAATRSQRR